MFASFAKDSTSIDPVTGRPFYFGLLGGGGLSNWNENATTPGSADGGGGVANTNRYGWANDQDFLRSIGYTNPAGANAWSGSADGGSNQDNPEFLQYLQDQGLRLAVSNDGPESDQWARGRAFDANNNAIGSEARWRPDVNEDAFLGAMFLGAGGAGLAAAGAGAGVAGAGEAASLGGAAGGAGGATNAALIDSYLGTTGYGASSGVAGVGAGAGGAAYGAGYAYPGFQVAGDAAVAPEGFFGGATGGEAGGSVLGDYGAGVTGVGGAGSSLSTAAGTPGFTVGSAGEALGAGGSAAGSSGSGWLGSINDALGTSFNGSQVAGALGSLGSSAISAYSASNAANQLRGATDAANANQLAMYNQSRTDWAPYREAGVGAVGSMRNLLANPSSIASDPQYQWQLSQGQQQLDRSAAARGMLGSGAQIKATTRFGQGTANDALDRALARFGNVAQLGATGTQGTQQAATNYANQDGANQTGLGSALAGASLYTGSTIGNALNSGLANWNRTTYQPGS